MKEVAKELAVIKEGILDVGGFKIRCYVCNDGNRYFNADDISGFFEALGDGLNFTDDDAMDIAKFIHGVGDLPAD